MKKYLFLALCCIIPLSVVAQATRPVRGVVFGEKNIPMQGATLTAVGSTVSATSSADGTFEMMVSPYTQFIEASSEGYLPAQAEIDGSYLVFRLVIDKKYYDNKAKAEEEARLAAEAQAKAEESARLAEERRIAAEKAAAEKAERDRIAAEERRIAAEKAAAERAEQARLAAEQKQRLAEEKRIAAEKAAAEKAEQARLAAEQKKRLEEEKQRLAEERRIAAEKAIAERLEHERIAAEKAAAEKAEQARLAEEQKQQLADNKQRLAEEKRHTEKLVAQKREQAISEAQREAMIQKQIKIDTRNANAQKWREAKLKGFRSAVEAYWNIDLSSLSTMYGVNYIGGYQFNNLIFAGLGTGLTFAGVQDGPTSDGYLPLNLLNIPVFAYGRVNFINNRCSPFFACTVGYRFSTKRRFAMPFEGGEVSYSTSGLILVPQIGIDFRTTTKTSLYLAVGANIMTRPAYEREISSATRLVLNRFYTYGIDLHFGFTF
ncbi:MAG: hypothetical protein IIX04_01810 [Alistipes sp.]|nr:hypothetical protein [Alistipes sp.]